jgi:hypothetical protein
MRSLTVNQEKLLAKVRSQSRKRADEILRRARLSSEQEVQLHAAKRKFERALLIINIELQKDYNGGMVIDSMLKAGRLFNRMEIGKFAGGTRDFYFRTRLLSEFKLYGATSDLQTIFGYMLDEERPHYAAVDYMDRGRSLASLQGYGFYRCELREELKQRATITPKDSLAAELDEVYLWEDIDGILATKSNGHFWFELVMGDVDPLAFDKGYYYIEAQILGGVRLSEIAILYHPAADMLDKNFFAKLKRLEVDHNIVLMHY